MTAGYIGPKKNPIKDTLTAFPIKDGTSQIVSSSLFMHINGESKGGQENGL
jgi:hypothetical protein